MLKQECEVCLGIARVKGTLTAKAGHSLIISAGSGTVLKGGFAKVSRKWPKMTENG